MRLRKSGRRCVRWSEDTLPEASAGAEGAHRSKIGHMYRLASAYGGTPRGASRASRATGHGTGTVPVTEARKQRRAEPLNCPRLCFGLLEFDGTRVLASPQHQDRDRTENLSFCSRPRRCVQCDARGARGFLAQYDLRSRKSDLKLIKSRTIFYVLLYGMKGLLRITDVPPAPRRTSQRISHSGFRQWGFLPPHVSLAFPCAMASALDCIYRNAPGNGSDPRPSLLPRHPHV